VTWGKRKEIFLTLVLVAIALAFTFSAAQAWTPEEKALLDKVKEIAAGNAGKWSLQEAGSHTRV